jgi:hypothetical protein
VVFRWNGLPVFDDLNDHSVTRRAFKRALVVIRLVGPEETLDIGMSGASTPSALRFLTHDVVKKTPLCWALHPPHMHDQSKL